MSGLLNLGYFIFTLAFNFIIYLLWFRMVLRYFRVSALHPISNLVNSITNPIVLPISAMLFRKKQISTYDWAALIVLIVIEIIKFVLIGMFFLTTWMPIQYVAFFTLADLIVKPCNFFFYAILIRAIMSLINPAWNHPLAGVLYIITQPFLRLGRKIIPDISGFDFSPFIMLLILKIFSLFISSLLPLPLV
jgi:YggT family protein